MGWSLIDLEVFVVSQCIYFTSLWCLEIEMKNLTQLTFGSSKVTCSVWWLLWLESVNCMSNFRKRFPGNITVMMKPFHIWNFLVEIFNMLIILEKLAKYTRTILKLKQKISNHMKKNDFSKMCSKCFYTISDWPGNFTGPNTCISSYYGI